MPHRCVRCGREYPTNECEILKGCRECGGKKFVFIPQVEREHEKEVTPSVTPARLEQALEDENSTAEEKEADTAPGASCLSGDRLESIRIVAPGRYELNIEKLATSDERVVGIGKGEGSYLVDLLSMVRPRRKKSKK